LAEWYKTRDGLQAVVFATDATKKRCYVGAYQSGDKWYPTDWCKGGRWHDKPGYKRGLDLMMENNAPTISQGQGPTPTTTD
jgi:hypothetical protein